jgi:hypothetical protein
VLQDSFHDFALPLHIGESCATLSIRGRRLPEQIGTKNDSQIGTSHLVDGFALSDSVRDRLLLSVTATTSADRFASLVEVTHQKFQCCVIRIWKVIDSLMQTDVP